LEVPTAKNLLELGGKFRNPVRIDAVKILENASTVQIPHNKTTIFFGSIQIP